MACDPIGATDRRIAQFGKIKNLDAITATIALQATEYDVMGLLDRADAECGIIPNGSFELVVDQLHPHNSLSELMHIAEYRFAYVVTEFMKVRPDLFGEIRVTLYQAGAAAAMTRCDYPEDAFTYISMRVLDGMPCDETVIALEIKKDRIVWKKLMETHEEFWLKAGSCVDYYYTLLECYIKGMLSKVNMSYSSENNEIFTIEAYEK